MSRFMLLYNGEATDMSQMTPEEGAAVMAKWGVWMAKSRPGPHRRRHAVRSGRLDRR